MKQMRKRVMIDGDCTQYVAEIDELSGECEITTHPNRLMAVTYAQHGSDGWPLWQAMHDEDSLIFEFRSDRNHLAVAAVGPTIEKVTELVTQAFENLS